VIQLDLFAQRWWKGRHSWRRRSEGGFDSSKYAVLSVSEGIAKAYVTEHHYSRSYPAARLRFGLFRREDEALVGVAVLSVPVRAAVLTGVFPRLEPYAESLELGRLVLADEVPANGETWMLGRVFAAASEVGVHGVVSFSDPVPRRRADGSLLFPGHVGGVYQAHNGVYTGYGTARSLIVLPDGTTLNDRAASKVRQRERGHEHVERRLIELGARRLAGADPSRLAARCARRRRGPARPASRLPPLRLADRANPA
jgi:hypothetical protein